MFIFTLEDIITLVVTSIILIGLLILFGIPLLKKIVLGKILKWKRYRFTSYPKPFQNHSIETYKWLKNDKKALSYNPGHETKLRSIFIDWPEFKLLKKVE